MLKIAGRDVCAIPLSTLLKQRELFSGHGQPTRRTVNYGSDITKDLRRPLLIFPPQIPRRCCRETPLTLRP
jgi:hypothetical protein